MISQADNYSANFGEILRSSAIFYAKNDDDLKTTICLSNYWMFKNRIDVQIFVNLRELSGKLANRSTIKFEESAVCNYLPPNGFEGSIEVEAFSIKNLRIPYAAIMAVYESKDSISMVHSYARAYSQHEIEDNRTISNGKESCWTLRDDEKHSSFSVIHNGPNRQRKQDVKLSIRNWRGNEETIKFRLEDLLPFETVIFEPAKYFGDLTAFLENRPGNARISFKLNGGFTRMLCGIKSNDNKQLQVTHSNFDYSIHDTDKLTSGNVLAYMRTPNIIGPYKQEIVVYPDTNRGVYTSEVNEQREDFKTGEIHTLPFQDNKGRFITLFRSDNILPTRIVTGLRLIPRKEIIPAECSMGVVHHNRPRKNFHWMLVSRSLNSQVCWVDFQEIYGGCPVNAEFTFKLYTARGNEELVRNFTNADLPRSCAFRLTDIFDEANTDDNYCYLSVWCSYGGLMFFSTLEKSESITIEHSF